MRDALSKPATDRFFALAPHAETVRERDHLPHVQISFDGTETWSRVGFQEGFGGECGMSHQAAVRLEQV